MEIKMWDHVNLAAIPSRTDPSVCGCRVEGRHIILSWMGGQYPVSLDDINEPSDALSVLHHVCKKYLREFDGKSVVGFIELVFQEKNWPLYGSIPHRNEAPKPNISVVDERSKMNHSIRYEVIKRDGYRCRACGFSVSDGAVLHVDHIAAIAKGGRTEMQNLQTLCTSCNLGKADR